MVHDSHVYTFFGSVGIGKEQPHMIHPYMSLHDYTQPRKHSMAAMAFHVYFSTVGSVSLYRPLRLQRFTYSIIRLASCNVEQTSSKERFMILHLIGASVCACWRCKEYRIFRGNKKFLLYISLIHTLYDFSFHLLLSHS